MHWTFYVYRALERQNTKSSILELIRARVGKVTTVRRSIAPGRPDGAAAGPSDVTTGRAGGSGGGLFSWEGSAPTGRPEGCGLLRPGGAGGAGGGRGRGG